MGQKTNPIGFRLALNKNWQSVWQDRKNYARLLEKDVRIRDFLRRRLRPAGVDRVEIQRSIGEVEINISVARPGLVIGRGGQNIEKLKEELNEMIEEKFKLNITEVSNPDLSARLIAEDIAASVMRGYPYKRAVRSGMRRVMEAGAGGVKVEISGRLGGGTIARTEKFVQGSIPTSTLKEMIDYGFAEAFTKYGTIGVKVWINKESSN